MTPRISVLMPVRDGQRWLGEAIASIANQTLTDFELVIVDDGSVDDTPRILAERAKADARIRVIRQERLGLVAALNRGLSEARGELIARLDADDLSFPQRLARQSEYLDNHPQIGLLGSWADTIGERGTITGALQPRTDDLATLLMRTNPFVHSSVMVRRSALQKAGAYRAAFGGAEDYDLWLRLSEIAGIAILPERLLAYRVHSDSVTASARVRQMFSTRLAQRAALVRRSGAPDPVVQLTMPPDYAAPESLDSPLYGDLARLYRVLALADAATIPADVDLVPLRDGTNELNHAERKLAQMALLNLFKQGSLIKQGAPYGRAALLWQFVRLHPLRAIKLALSAD